MENMGEWEQRSLINELTQGREVARQLLLHLNAPSSSSSSHETRELLVTQIQASYEKALSMLNCNTSSCATDPPPPQSSGLAVRMTSESPPPSHSASPRSDDSADHDHFKEHELRLDAYKKRKSLPRWAQQVRVTPGTALEGPLDDGFSWRKYGQKDILGAKYPRGYYRCTHRNGQGCLARKQVQRSDEDPTIFEITYRGQHTCNVASSSQVMVHPPPGSSENQEQQQAQQEPSQDLLLNFQRELKVVTHDLEIGEQVYPTSFPINYPSSMASNVFSPPLIGNNSSNLSSPFISPATSGLSSTDHLLGNINFANSSDNYQAAASSTNSPTVGLDFPFGSTSGGHQFDPNFTLFDNNGFFS